MRISYTYHNYPNCPRATEYSKAAESSAAYGSMFLGLVTIGAAIFFLVCTFSFFGNYNWGEFLGAIAFAIGAALIDFYAIVIRPNNTECEIRVILTEDSNRRLPAATIAQFCEALRKENKKQNKETFMRFFPVFLVSLFDAVALIATIKGVYFLCHKEDGLFLLLGGIVAIGILSYLIWRLVKGPSPKPTTSILSSSNEQPVPTANSTGSGDIAFCRKCGAKILSDSVFCAKCGTKVR